VQGRIWDFKDLYVESVAAFWNQGVGAFYNPYDQKHSLVDDWISEEGDESTNLALLDVLLEPAHIQSAFRVSNETKSRAEATIAHCPTAMKSRSFIRWILASAVDALAEQKKGEDDFWVAYETHNQGFPGMVWHARGCFLPGIYVPRNAENPGWIAPEISLVVNEPIQLALNLAKELKDYKSQVACLKLLIFLSSDPTQLFQELASLQKSVQGDKQGHLETMLSSYLICKDRTSKENLLEELQQTEDWRDDLGLRDGLMYWSRDFIERALKRSLQGPKSTANLRNPPGFYMGKELPWEAEQFTWQHAGHADYPQTTMHPPYRYTHDDPVTSVQERGEQIGGPYLRPFSPSRRHFPWHEPHSQTPAASRGDESYNRREREAGQAELSRREKRELERLEAARAREAVQKEIQLMKNEELVRKAQKDAEVALRAEEVKRVHKEEMEKRAAELKHIEQEISLEKERHDREMRTQQDRETRERLERAEALLQDQAKRLRRAEDRSYRDWLAGRDNHRRERPRTRRPRNTGRRKASVATMSPESSDTYSSDDPPYSDEEDSSVDLPHRRVREKDVIVSSGTEEDITHESRVLQTKPGIFEESWVKRRKDKADLHNGEHGGKLQTNPCTDLILYNKLQITRSPDEYVSAPSVLRSPTPAHFQGDVEGQAENTNVATMTGAAPSSPTAIKHQKLEERDELYESDGRISLDRGENTAQRKTRQEKQDRVDMDGDDGQETRINNVRVRESFQEPVISHLDKRSRCIRYSANPIPGTCDG
jgi:hypothetical protein